jgi:hypothetical protein
MKTCSNCVYWEMNDAHQFEGYCAARVEITDSVFSCEEHGCIDDGKPAETVEDGDAGVVGHP